LEGTTIALLSTAGLGISLYLWLSLATGRSVVCLSGTCEAVLRTPYARMFKVYNSAIGAVFYALLIGFTLSPSFLPPLEGLARLGIVAASAASLPVFAYLTYVQLFILRAICEWCLASALLTGLILVIALWWAT